MHKFVTVYNIILNIWHVASDCKELNLAEDKLCEVMTKKLNEVTAHYTGREQKLAMVIASAIMEYLFEKGR